MKKSKFFTLLRTLDKEELNGFERYLKQNHPSEGFLVAVFDYVQKFSPKFDDDKKLDIGYAYKKIFKKDIDESKANRRNMLNTLSDLHVCLKQFLLLEKLKSDSFEGRTFWMSILRERGLMPEFSRKAALLQREVENMPKSSIPDYMKGMVSNHYFYYHLTQDKQKENIAALIDCGKDLDLFYAVSRLKIACELANRRQVMAQAYEMEPLPAIVELSKTHLVSDHPLLALYMRVYELISSQQGHLYPEIESMLKANMDKIGPEEIHTVLGYLHNYLAFRLRRGDDAYLTLTHSLNKFAVEHRVLSRSGEISANQFTNIVSVSCAVGEIGWANSFIENNQISLPENLREDAVTLAKAIVHFEKKEFGEVLVKLRGISYHDLLFTIRTRALILRSQYEIAGDDKSAVVDYCIAFEASLKRSRIPKREAVEAAKNFISIVKKLAAGKSSKESLLEMIQQTSPLYHKDWLLQKLA